MTRGFARASARSPKARASRRTSRTRWRRHAGCSNRPGSTSPAGPGCRRLGMDLLEAIDPCGARTGGPGHGNPASSPPRWRLSTRCRYLIKPLQPPQLTGCCGARAGSSTCPLPTVATRSRTSPAIARHRRLTEWCCGCPSEPPCCCPARAGPERRRWRAPCTTSAAARPVRRHQLRLRCRGTAVHRAVRPMSAALHRCHARHAGVFEQAAHGTLLLTRSRDAAALQVYLLRILETGR